ncbi:MAG: hypothetical protein ABIH23_28270 [bacterium]
MGQVWKILPSCTVREEEDGTGFVFNADDDRLHPLNKMATELLQELGDGAATEEEIFEKMWPHLEAMVRDSVREDFRAFLLAMTERGCLAKEGDAQEEGVAEARADIYSPPLVEDLGRRRRPEADASEPPKTNEDRLQRRRFLAVGAGALAAMAVFPRKASAAACATGDHPPDYDVCDGTGLSPTNYLCDNGSTPSGKDADCYSVGYRPDDGEISNDCFNGFNPLAGFCQTNGTQPWGDYGDCNDTGYSPSNFECHFGYRPT